MRGNKVDTAGEEKNGDLLLEASGDLPRCTELDLSKGCSPIPNFLFFFIKFQKQGGGGVIPVYYDGKFCIFWRAFWRSSEAYQK